MLIQLLKALWHRWKAFGHWLATVQSRIMLFVFYFIVLGPFALVMRALSDPLRLGSRAPVGWLPREAVSSGRKDLDIVALARRQF